VGPEEIDRINILQASMRAMELAVEDLKVSVDLVLVDGNRVPSNMPCPATAIVKGDSRAASIAAGSIIAKVTRDRMMDEAHEQYPKYRFDRHKGYPTKFHVAALEIFGPCELHRRSYAPVAQHASPESPTDSFKLLFDYLSEGKNGFEGEFEKAKDKLKQAERYYLDKQYQYLGEGLK
jgi:ribonuclease HII